MKLFYFTLLLLLAASCKKDDNPQPTSTWVIGTDSFSTNQVSVSHYRDGISIEVGAKPNAFYYRSIVDGLPYDGRYFFNLLMNQNDANRPRVGFDARGKSYSPLDSGYMQVSRTNGIVIMSIDSVRFINYIDSTDIKIVKATVRVREN